MSKIISLSLLFFVFQLFPKLAISSDVIMSYNVLCNVCNRNPQFLESWDQRKPHVFDVIEQESPDLLGLQEIYGSMFQDFTQKFSSYDFYSGTMTDETLSISPPGLMNVVAYKKAKYRFIKGGSFRLSDQENSTVPIWVDAYKRVCTWTELETKTDEPQRFKFLSCHLPIGNEGETKKSAQKISTWIWSQNDSDLPHFVVGDFNASSFSSSIQYLIKPKNFFSNYIYPDKFTPMIDSLDEPKIDFVFRVGGKYAFSESYKTGQDAYSGIFRPSDHPAIVMRQNHRHYYNNSYYQFVDAGW